MTTGVLVMAYGSPRHPDDVEAYYTHIRRGRPPSPEQLADLVGRYRAIGGTSPLAARSEDQRATIAAVLERRAPGEFVVALGHKHAPPFIEDAVATLKAHHVTRVVVLALAPHSSSAVVQYHERACAAAGPVGLEYLSVASWHLEPALIAFLDRAVRDASATLPSPPKIIFTAHSLPQRHDEESDAYRAHLRETAAAVARRTGLAEWSQWAIAWQSAGRTPEPWMGPDILTVLRDLGGSEGAQSVVICPCGFVADHLEVLYDLDIEAARVARELGLVFARTRSVNADAAVMDALAALVVAKAAT